MSAQSGCPKGADPYYADMADIFLCYEPLITGQITCPQSVIRLMLLGSPPDMVHGSALGRAFCPVIKGSLFLYLYMIYLL